MPDEAPAHLFGRTSCCHGLENCLATKGNEEFHPLKMSKTYTNPTIPFKINIKLVEQKHFVIIGRPLSDDKRFTFNFQKGLLSDAPNIAFQFDVNCRNRVIAMNYRFDSTWGREIREITKFPFSEKDQFTLEIMVDSQMYEVKVNDEEVAQFQHQRSMEVVDAFTIEGDVVLSEVKVM
ncbi:hypothetical protein CHS0354_015370 [Potamilus streckersoni]|uniref:Galectin n=1 Tax=Potamilus streckersoni TaxID=2493646 RepID=A0AAE0TC46_9BIVA|nr:hypothetical protein CHS0354_015370 [Potamilus streckersoni]